MEKELEKKPVLANELSFIDKIVRVQNNLKAPKGQYNMFGGFKYRSCEDITEAIKPLLSTHNLILNMSDELVMIGDRYYIKATAMITDGKESVLSTAYARESLELKGMTDSQITGAASSYARKYALNGLLAIDDTNDADVDLSHLDKQLIQEATNLNIELDKVAKYFKKSINELTNDDLKGCIEQKKKALGGEKNA